MPTAFFCNSDLAASMMYQKLVREGYDVTGDISIVGFDNYLVDQFAGIGLTTYEIDTKEMAKRVVHIILHKLLNARYSTGTFVIPGRFIERESVRRIGPRCGADIFFKQINKVVRIFVTDHTAYFMDGKIRGKQYFFCLFLHFLPEL